MSEGEDRRAENAAEAWKSITGEDPRRGTESMSVLDQRRFVAERVREIVDKGFSPYVVIEMLIAGAAFLGDNFGVSRERMAHALATVRVTDATPTLILDPKAR